MLHSDLGKISSCDKEHDRPAYLCFNQQDLLAGQILWVSLDKLVPVAVLSAVILGLWCRYGRRFGHFGFYALFALAVTTSVQLVGVYLVFASLIIPALGSRHITAHRQLVAYGIGLVGYAVGLALSMAFDLPSGPVIVWSLALAGAFAQWRSSAARRLVASK